MTLSELRSEIDKFDDEIASLLARRMAFSKQVAAIKRESGTPVLQPDRENSILTRLGEQIEPHYVPALETVYEAIFRASRELQEGLI